MRKNLTADSSDMETCLKRDIPTTFGERTVLFNLIDHIPSAAEASLAYEMFIAQINNIKMILVECLELVLILSSEKRALIIVIHCFVRLSSRESFSHGTFKKVYSTVLKFFISLLMRSGPAGCRNNPLLSLIFFLFAFFFGNLSKNTLKLYRDLKIP